MTKELKKHPLNARGKYYVDQDICTCSGNCVYVAPTNFKMYDESDFYVSKQPETPEEESLCRQAMDECPVEAILDDGEP